jgi:charged multivesicular body protein 3
MVEDAIDTLDEDEEELEEEAEAEVQNVLFNITDGKLGQMGAVGSKLPQVRLILLPLLHDMMDFVH